METRIALTLACFLLAAINTQAVTPPTDVCTWASTDTVHRIAVVGDFGVSTLDNATGLNMKPDNNEDPMKVSQMIQSWNPHIVITVGDNNYYKGVNETIDPNIGQYYYMYIHPYKGSYGNASATSFPHNRMFPSPGNHDWGDSEGITPGLEAYLWFFESIPMNGIGQGRYYDIVCGNAHLFSIDNDPSEPDGNNVTSKQFTQWFVPATNASTSAWQIAYMHYPAYCSGENGPNTYAQWKYENYGIDAVFAGHEHNFERLEIPHNHETGYSIPYFVQGTGGHPLGFVHYNDDARSAFQYNKTFGATLIEVTATYMNISTYSTESGQLIDQRIMVKPGTPTTVTQYVPVVVNNSVPNNVYVPTTLYVPNNVPYIVTKTVTDDKAKNAEKGLIAAVVVLGFIVIVIGVLLWRIRTRIDKADYAHANGGMNSNPNTARSLV